MAAAVIVLGALGAFLLLGKGDGSDHVLTVPRTVTETRPSSSGNADSAPTTTSPLPSPVETNISLAAIENLLGEYQSAYSREDVAALESLFTHDLVRLPGTGPPQDLAEALTTYEDQFSELADPIYQLRGVHAESNSSEAKAVGHYSITDSGRDAGSGRIVFHIVRLGDVLYIDRLEITPSG